MLIKIIGSTYPLREAGYLRSGLDAPNRLKFVGLSLEVADRAINEIGFKVFLKLSEERRDAGVEEVRTEGPRFAILKERA